MQSLHVGLALLILLTPAAAIENSAAAIGAFKALEGKWAIQSNGETLAVQMTYDIGSKGSIVTEQFGKELSVFYRDGENLLMTHFCNGGNEPRLRLKESKQPGLFEFEMFDITNLKNADAAHVQKIIYKIVGDKTIDLEIVWQEGKELASEKYILSKI